MELEEVRELLQKKEEKHDVIYVKEKQLVTAYQAIMDINPKDFLKAKGVVSILDKEFEMLD